MALKLGDSLTYAGNDAVIALDRDGRHIVHLLNNDCECEHCVHKFGSKAKRLIDKILEFHKIQYPFNTGEESANRDKHYELKGFLNHFLENAS